MSEHPCVKEMANQARWSKMIDDALAGSSRTLAAWDKRQLVHLLERVERETVTNIADRIGLEAYRSCYPRVANEFSNLKASIMKEFLNEK